MSNSDDEDEPMQDDDTSDTSKCKPKNRANKRKRISSDSSSDEDALPENTLDMERSLHATAVKNNIDDISMRKILKKVVTNDHVLALVRLREEEEDSSLEERKLRPKITRAKAKELMKVSPKSAPKYAELTPIDHIPVKTRPEVSALIAQELPEDEDDEEYEPTQEDVPSDDDHVLESCSDLDSQPRTPVTPKTQPPASPKVLQDGPFKVPQEVSSARKQLNLEEEATIALRTRSKLSLSETSIEHIESTFVPPDDLPMPVGDDLWNQFLTDCLDPAHTTRHEDDDDADPEYNFAADPDADEEDDAFGRNISKKELSDLVTELFNIMPEATEDADLAEDLANSVLNAGRQAEFEQVATQWEGKKEQASDDEPLVRIADRIQFENKSIGADYPGNVGETDGRPRDDANSNEKNDEEQSAVHETIKRTQCFKITLEEEVDLPKRRRGGDRLPPVALRRTLTSKPKTHQVQIIINNGPCMLPEQVCILQQQLRQHVQLAASNFLQLYVHPLHWALAPTYKDYLETLLKMSSKPNSVVKVCNLQPAVELIRSWEKSVAEDTPENAAMVKFIQDQADRCRRRISQNSLYVGEFHEMFLKVIANSPVFLYPYLLPSMPYRAEPNTKRFNYLPCEDELIALGLDEFWLYVESNPTIFRSNAKFNPRHRWGLNVVAQLVIKHMVPWLTTKSLLQHIQHIRKHGDKDNPICKFFANREVTPVKHRLLPYNPKLTLYEQPEHEVPRIWLRYLSKTSRRFRAYMMRRTNMTGQPARGVEIDLGNVVGTPQKNPLPIRFTKEIDTHRTNLHPVQRKPVVHDKYDLLIENGPQDPENTVLISSAPQEPVITAPNTIIVSPMPPNGNSLTHNTYNTIVVPPVSQNCSMATNTMLVPAITQQPRMTEKIITLAPMVPNTGLQGQNTVILTPLSQKVQKTNQNVTPQLGRYPKIENLITVCTTSKNSGTFENTMTISPLPRGIPRTTEIVTPITPIHRNSRKSHNTTPNTNFYKVVETSTGAFLVPFNMNTKNINPKTAPVLTAVDETTSVLANDLPESSNSRDTPPGIDIVEDYMGIEESKEHCRCCILLRRITKIRQTVITDYFNSPCKVDKACPCKSIKFPRISRKLRLLLRFYRSKSLSIIEDLEAKLESTAGEDAGDCGSSDWSLDELAYVTTYQLKLAMRTNVARNNFIKRRVNRVISSFNMETGDPIVLARNLFKVFEAELVDVYKEFLAFLTPEQADKMDVFKDYFVRHCVPDLMKKVEAYVSEKKKQVEILTKLHRVLKSNFATACNICFALLSTMDHPKLAEYVFYLFPHRVESRCVENPVKETTATVQTEQVDETIVSQDNNVSQVTVDYEADHSSSGEDEDSEDSDNSIRNIDEENIQRIKQELSSSEQTDTVVHTADKEVNQTELQDSESSETMMIMSEEESVKTEPPDWQREEDKLILEMLQQHLTPNELKDKTLIEIMEEKNIVGLISESLIHKSISDIKQRIIYLLKIL